jgi:hypothetical protein
MTLTAIVREAADIAADNAHWPRPAGREYSGCLRGIRMSKSGFADKQRRGVVAHAQAGGMLDGEPTIRAYFTRFDLQVTAQRVRHHLGPSQGTYRRAAYAHDGAARRLPIEHPVEIDDTMHVGERHTQRAAHFCRNRFGNPATELLSSVQGWQERRATLRRQLGKDRVQGNEFAVSHLVFQASVSFHLHFVPRARAIRSYLVSRPYTIRRRSKKGAKECHEGAGRIFTR